ncbi:MAG: single-stranded DNA-binding protein [Microscillaceae bacterium]|nr:single-stranded DNA-binding protein [Microscillaceae bacterium]MDW8461878.1 single-stranded DNA-binding protein [Cytophagales bacterium]
MAGEVKVAKFSLATTELYKDAQGQKQSHTEWYTVLAWRSLADLAEKYLHKGSLAYIEDKLKTRAYQAKKRVKLLCYRNNCPRNHTFG